MKATVPVLSLGHPVLWVATVGALVLIAVDAHARPGGGQGYSGGGGGGYSGGGSSGGGGGGEAEIIYLLVRLIIAYPAVGIPVATVVVIGFVMHRQHATKLGLDQFGGGTGLGLLNLDDGDATLSPPRKRYTDPFAALRRVDPNFSAVLFEDFVYALYARVYEARGDAAAMAGLAPYIAETPRSALTKREPTRVKIHSVIVGAMRVVQVTHPKTGKHNAGIINVEIEFEANFTAVGEQGQPQGYFVHERWQLERSAAVQSKPPGPSHEFRCPNCGAAFVASDGDRCRYCGQDVGGGRFDWTIVHVRLQRQQKRPPALTADVVEQGTHDATVFQPKIRELHTALVVEDPGTAPQLIEARLRTIYAALNSAWTARDLRPVRPFVSDSIYNYLNYWIRAYQDQGLRNELKDMAIERVQIVKLVRDRYFDAITLRFWASGLDYTVEAATGKRISGSPRTKRAYSEYWTLIRGAQVRGAPRDANNCPSCGAPLDRVNMAGNCEYCGAHLTRGEFDWVLSKIEQDESYSG